MTTSAQFSESGFPDAANVVVAFCRAGDALVMTSVLDLIDAHIAAGRAREVMIGLAAIAGAATSARAAALKKSVPDFLAEIVLPSMRDGWFEGWKA